MAKLAQRRQTARPSGPATPVPGKAGDAAAPLDVAATLRTALGCHQSGNLAQAGALYGQVLAQEPDNPNALHLMGVLAHQSGKHEAAIGYIERAQALRPDDADIRNNLGMAYLGAARLEAAVREFERALALRPGFPQAHDNLGDALLAQGRCADARRHYQAALAAMPERAALHGKLGSVAEAEGRLDEALSCYQRATALDPNLAEAQLAMGNALKALGRPGEAEAAYRRALAIDPRSAAARYSLSLVCHDQGRRLDAVEHGLEALAADPGRAETYFHLAVVFHEIGRHNEATECSRKGLALAPDSVKGHRNLAVMLQGQGQPEAAAACFRDALRLDPDDAEARTGLFEANQAACCWQDRDGELEQVLASVERALAAGERSPVMPWTALSLPLTPATQLAIARDYAAWVAAGPPLEPGAAWAEAAPERLRIGYVSDRFGEAATAHLMRGVFGKHDRGGFEVFAYAFGRDDGSAYRRRIARDCDAFIDIDGASHRQAAERIRGDGIHILVDLKGYTRNARPQIFALRPAPLQASYIGHTGTMGAGFIDYVIADPVVTPPADQDHYAEKLVLMPQSYMATDDKQAIAEDTPGRADCGLPVEGTVFCGFNQTYKIEPQIFDIWMKILDQTPGSVLWLLDGPAAANLRAEASARGVDPDRLVFAERQAKDRHLARHRLADLFLDTLVYNAHTTACDALWAGLPVLTCPGETFSSRVAASLLTAIGLPELIAPDPAAYERLALVLAGAPAELERLRQKLAAKRKVAPLFDTARFVRNLEAAFRMMWRLRAAGEVPRLLEVREAR